MSKTRLDRFSKNPETHRRLINRTIREAMARNDIASDKAMGEMIGLSPAQICNRFSNGHWSAYELYRIGQVLHFTEAESIKMLGG